MRQLISTTCVLAALVAGQTAFGQSVTTTQIRGSGNSVTVTSNGSGSIRVSTHDRGQNNQVIVTHNGKIILPKEISYAGKDNKFWSHKKWDAELKQTLYYCAKTKLWFRYHDDKEAYRPAVEYYEREARRAEAEVQKTLDEVDRLLEELERTLPRE